MGVNRYLVDRVLDLANDRPVLDLGCGDGRLLRRLDDRIPGRVYGFDLERQRDKAIQNLSDHRLREALTQHIRWGKAGDPVPFPGEMFGLIVSNQVLEHVQDLDHFFSECSRLLHGTGVVLLVFPPVTHILEAHTRVPFAHWLPSGPTRQRYLRAWRTIFGRPHDSAQSRAEQFWDAWLAKNTFYRSTATIKSIAFNYFAEIESDRRAYAESLSGWPTGALLAPILDVTLNCCLLLRRPIRGAPSPRDDRNRGAARPPP